MINPQRPDCRSRHTLAAIKRADNLPGSSHRLYSTGLPTWTMSATARSAQRILPRPCRSHIDRPLKFVGARLPDPTECYPQRQKKDQTQTRCYKAAGKSLSIEARGFCEAGKHLKSHGFLNATVPEMKLSIPVMIHSGGQRLQCVRWTIRWQWHRLYAHCPLTVLQAETLPRLPVRHTKYSHPHANNDGMSEQLNGLGKFFLGRLEILASFLR